MSIFFYCGYRPEC